MSLIPGINIVSHGNSHYCAINLFSDELKEIISNELSNVWNGFAEVEESPEIHSYKRTLDTFLDRYNDKSDNTKKGMIGELLAHILIQQYFKDFTSLSVLKNKEERSIKKGFDIIYHDSIASGLWYSEVKSGRRESGSETSNEYNTILLERSHSSISKMFSEKRSSLWDSALVDVKLTIPDRKGRLDLKRLLDNDSPVHGQNDKKNVVLISVLYHHPSEDIDIETIKHFHEKVTIEGNYSDNIVFSIQKELFEKVAEFLQQEALK